MTPMDNKQYVYFLKRLREARYAVLEDAENFTEVCFVLEELGVHLLKKGEKKSGLNDYKPKFQELLIQDNEVLELFNNHFEKLRHARNDQAHRGVCARNAAQHAVKISIILEESIMSALDKPKLGHIMIDNVICVEEYTKLAKIRELMLRYSFSYIPYCSEGKYYLLSDFYIAELWNSYSINERYTKSIQEIIKEKNKSLEEMKYFEFNTELNGFEIPDKPILIYQNSPDNIVGILTPFDFL